MILHSIRLKNIRSYGEGPDGNGVTVDFRRGTNCVVGNNGCGKTTLIEALGYALFGVRPQYEETFKASVYFLRHDTKQGEIAVTFEVPNEGVFRVERGFGAGIRSKVVEVANGSICSEDETAVNEMICRLLAVPRPERLQELFAKLVGVAQGRLTWPFDARPAATKEHFGPLLDVDVFLDAAERLSQTEEGFEDVIRERQPLAARLDALISDRAASEKTLSELLAHETAAREAEQAAREAWQKSDMTRSQLEKQEETLQALERALNEARHASALAEQRTGAGRASCEAAREAKAVVVNNQAGQDAFLAADSALGVLQQKQAQRAGAQENLGKARLAAAGANAKHDQAIAQADTLTKRREEESAAATAFSAAAARDKAALDATEKTFATRTEAVQAALKARQELAAYHQQLRTTLTTLTAAAERLRADAGKLAAWDGRALDAARQAEEAVNLAARDAAEKHARETERKTTLEQQLQQIAGGRCPFLKEPCQQFQHAKVQSDIGSIVTLLAQLEQEKQRTVGSHAVALKKLKELERAAAALDQVRSTMTRSWSEFVATHHGLLPPSLAPHLHTLREFLPAQAQAFEFTFDRSLDGAGTPKAGEALPAPNEELLKAALATQAALLTQVSRSLTDTSQAFRVQEEAHKVEGEKRIAALAQVNATTGQAQAAEKRAAALNDQISAQNKHAAQAAEAFAAAGKEVEQFAAALARFGDLEAQVSVAQAAKAANAPGHERYLGAQAEARKLPGYEHALQDCVAAEAKVKSDAETRAQAFQSALRAFDPEALKQARVQAAGSLANHATKQAELQNLQKQIPEARTRFVEWEAACKERETLRQEIGRLEASAELAKKAGSVLKKAAPKVASQLCAAIATQAQVIFNRINAEAIELEWVAEPAYRLFVRPGNRHFAMLSGGEQTKLALTMTLAMIEQFSGLRFAVFDEPTYGVDAESRQKLADAILEAREAARLDQLIVVSHDGVFETKAEHVIVLKKTAGIGTQVAPVC
jgi:exonuclease SbcC